jgi:hypothetical protein
MLGIERRGEGPSLSDRLECHEPKFGSRWREGNDQRSTWFHIYQHRSDLRSTLDNEFYMISDLAVVASLSDVADG